jgi:hypothetical protein
MVARLALIPLLCSATPSNAAEKPCSSSQAEVAQAAVEAAGTWQALALAEQRFCHCDMGYVAEANSEAVVRLLVDHWNTVPELASVTGAKPRFLPFVLRHLDTTADAADLERVVHLATTQCPVASRRLCTRLAIAAKRAITE